ncbi:MAG TPA: bifunctional phosphoribosylaminoimidazolecarboxamide formyltransferase/IMP cyclohydrolase [Candidatus Diapherotrites archaeon]|uniref:Bifunctional phosphoribosylaminoimidazolecarboxamide formyltransferase/IMP cyclohydrolase n=1 Tax=Candidatus Iainarchaeum sp. TaxID=3101447 RepID=A0A7J4JG51_9ARCH|nr:bifunctional phosphoribosylaminoimidazolecarboxamide formyltransferase/IMP cyclohydrolase [Candidatus Diapherotrites archaeon]HIH16688.1 bifunctional phosphoribosylaminoimidazolecarboxamide formyltransferase/IMP cyclohydrolase [Candidatus Diapherotrites archaeon]
MKIKTALVSVSSKEGLVPFVKELAGLGIKIVSTGGTARALKQEGLAIQTVEELTGFPEMLDGRVKTLHPKVHGGILANRTDLDHVKQLKEQGIEAIDLVVVNLYPFKETIAKPHASLEEIIENIDIGGPTLIRAAAKNHEFVSVVVNPEWYEFVLEEIRKTGSTSLETRRKLAREAFEYTAWYDALIGQWLGKRFGKPEEFPERFTAPFEKRQALRYGENPHQHAAFYQEPLVAEPCIASAQQVQGKELSFNNVADADAALELVKEFREPAAVIVKHNNPCGAAQAKTLSEAFRDAFECDQTAAFGGVIALNRACDESTAKQIASFFNEIVAAPDFEPAALEALKAKPNVRLLKVPGLESGTTAKRLSLRKVAGGLLVQDDDQVVFDHKTLKVVTRKEPGKEQLDALLFAFTVAKHVKSNAIVLAQGTKTVGIGAGQMSRIDSTEMAVKKAGERAQGAVLASDAFFPFPDNVEATAKAGVSAVIQPGGSVKDPEVIAAADRHGLAMVFTGLRHFKH